MQRTFYVKAFWDEEAEVFCSESDIKGLHIEAETIEEFESILHECAIELIIANHVTANEIASSSFKDLVPAILWQKPENTLEVA